MKKLFITLGAICFCSTLFSQQMNYITPLDDHHNQEIKFELKQYEIRTYKTSTGYFSKIISPRSLKTNEKGYPEVPMFTLATQIPSSKNMDLIVEPGEFEEIQLNYHLLPSRGTIYRNQDKKKIPYKYRQDALKLESYPHQRAAITKPYVIKDLRGVTISFYPFEYDAVTMKLKIYKTIRVKLVSNSEVPINPINNNNKPTSDVRSVYKSVFKNYSQVQNSNLRFNDLGDLLVISTPRDAAAIKPYIDWKKEKGFNVSHLEVSRGTNVKDLVKQTYDENNNLFYVCLVGDWEDIKSDLMDIAEGDPAPVDNRMGCVAGTDDIPDISIGRISADSPDDVTNQINKFLYYEKEIDENAEWLKNALTIASAEGPGDDNEMDFEHLSNIWSNKLNKYTYTRIDSLKEDTLNIANNPTAKQVGDIINQGVGIINYIGHGSENSWVTSEFSSGDISNLSENKKYPFIFSVACVNGTFHLESFPDNSNECFAENFVRKKDAGAVVFLGSTINQPWNEPMRGQDYMNDILIGGYDYSKFNNQNGISTDEQRTTIGSIVFNSFALMLSESPYPADIETVLTWTLFGDPTLQIRTKESEPVTISNTNIEFGIPFSTTARSNGNIENITVSLSQDDKVFTSKTDANGNVTIDQSLLPGKAILAVTGFNKKTFSKEIEIVAPNSAVPIVSSIDVISRNSGGKIELNEHVKFNLKIKNYGAINSEPFNLVLRTNSDNIEIIDSLIQVTGINANDSVSMNECLKIKLVNPLKNNSEVPVYFSCDYNNTSYNRNYDLLVAAPELTIEDYRLVETNIIKANGLFDSGETVEIKIPVKNKGSIGARNINSSLTTTSDYLSIKNIQQSLTALEVDSLEYLKFEITSLITTPMETAVSLVFTLNYNNLENIKESVIYISKAPEFLIHTGADTTDLAWLYDDGGEENDYSTNKAHIYTIYPKLIGTSVKAEFQYFDVEEGYDFLSIFNGADTNAAVLVNKATGSQPLASVVATNPEGILTFYFISDDIETRKGWKAKITNELHTSVTENDIELPENYELVGNYPNPFNPSTNIKFAIPQNDVITVAIYNILGQKIITLINQQEYKAGNHSIRWNGKSQNGGWVSSGIYFYRLATRNYSATKKMLLLK